MSASESGPRDAHPPAAPAAKRVAIIQSAYIPWKGFFDLVGRCDEYVILDGAQFVKRHWHNRNQIKDVHRHRWLTIPVTTKSRFAQPIDEVEIAGPWTDRHWQSIEHVYCRMPHFKTYAPRVRAAYEALQDERLLTRVNESLMRLALEILGMGVTVTRDRDYAPRGRRSERLLDICLKAGAKRYLSGPSARGYLDEAMFADAGVGVEWMAYGPYPSYPQSGRSFVNEVSVLDVIFNTGPEAGQYVRPDSGQNGAQMR